jgi:hypothetical protein
MINTVFLLLLISNRKINVIHPGKEGGDKTKTQKSPRKNKSVIVKNPGIILSY